MHMYIRIHTYIYTYTHLQYGALLGHMTPYGVTIIQTVAHGAIFVSYGNTWGDMGPCGAMWSDMAQ